MFILGMGGKPGGKSRPKPARTAKPRPPRPVHPGLQKVAVSDRCRKCGDYLEWFAFGLGGSFSAALCECGLWIMDQRLHARLIRFDTGQYLLGEGPLFHDRAKASTEGEGSAPGAGGEAPRPAPEAGP